MKKILLLSLMLILGAIVAAQTLQMSEESAVCGYSYFKSKVSQKIKDEVVNVEPFMQFWAKLRYYVGEKKIDLSKDYKVRLKGDFPNGKISEGDISFSLNHAQPELLDLFKDFTVAVDESKLLKVIALESFGEKVNGADLQIDFGETEVDFKLMLKTNSENTAERVTTRFKLLFAATSYVVANNPEGEFYKNAVITSEKEKVFVHGKISRASLEKFLSYD